MTWNMWRHSGCFPFCALHWLSVKFGCCESESTLNRGCLIILNNIAVYNCDIYVHVDSASVSNVGFSFIMLKIKQPLHLEVAIHKLRKIPISPLGKLHNRGRRGLGKLRKCGRKWLDQLAVFSFSSPAFHLSVGRETLIFVWILLVLALALASVSAWHFLVCLISCEPVIRFLPNFHGYMTGT